MCKAILELELINQDKKAIELIENAMKNTKQTFEEVCTMLGVAKADMNRYKEMI